MLVASTSVDDTKITMCALRFDSRVLQSSRYILRARRPPEFSHGQDPQPDKKVLPEERDRRPSLILNPLSLFFVTGRVPIRQKALG